VRFDPDLSRRERISYSAYSSVFGVIHALCLYLQTIEGFLNIQLPFPISLRSSHGFHVCDNLKEKTYALHLRLQVEEISEVMEGLGLLQKNI